MPTDETQVQPDSASSEPQAQDNRHTSSLSSLFSSLDPAERLLAMQAAASVLSGRYQFSQLTGYGFTSFEGLRDFFSALGFKRQLTIADYRDRYKRGGIASTLVNLLPDEMWDDGVFIRETDYDPENLSGYETDTEYIWKKHNIESRLLKADKLAGLGRYSIVLIGIKGDTDLSQPMHMVSGPDNLIYLLQYAEDYAKVEDIDLETDLSSPRLGQPKYYRLTNIDKTKPHVTVHWTRIIHIAHGLLESDWIGTPDLEVSWNDLDSLYKTSWGGSEAAWRNMDSKRQWDLNPDFDQSSPKAEELLKKMVTDIEDMRHNLKSDILTSGVTGKPLNVQVDKYGSNVETHVKMIGGTHRIPYTLLLGEELGLRAGEQNREDLNISVGSRRKKFGDPLVRQLQDRFIEYGIVAKPRNANGDYDIVWGVEEELTEDQKAELAERLAKANQSQSVAGGGLIYTSNDIRDKCGDEPIDEDKLADYNLESKDEPPNPEPVPTTVPVDNNVIPFSDRELQR